MFLKLIKYSYLQVQSKDKISFCNIKISSCVILNVKEFLLNFRDSNNLERRFISTSHASKCKRVSRRNTCAKRTLSQSELPTAVISRLSWLNTCTMYRR